MIAMPPRIVPSAAKWCQLTGSCSSQAPQKKAKKIRGQKDVPAAAADSVAKASWSISQFKVPAVEGKTRFHDFDLPDQLLHAIYDLGYEYCTPIQAEILPSTLSGKDASGRAQTGTGKTAAFLITIITRMIRNPISGKRSPGTPRVLILAPTRELVRLTVRSFSSIS